MNIQDNLWMGETEEIADSLAIAVGLDHGSHGAVKDKRTFGSGESCCEGG